MLQQTSPPSLHTFASHILSLTWPEFSCKVVCDYYQKHLFRLFWCNTYTLGESSQKQQQALTTGYCLYYSLINKDCSETTRQKTLKSAVWCSVEVKVDGASSSQTIIIKFMLKKQIAKTTYFYHYLTQILQLISQYLRIWLRMQHFPLHPCIILLKIYINNKPE